MDVKWCRRYIQEGENGLNDKRGGGGRPSKLAEEIAFQLWKELLESKQGWNTEQVNDMMVRRRVDEQDTIIHISAAYAIDVV